MSKHKELIKEFKEVMVKNGISNAMAAKGIGVSASALSQWINGVYKGNSSRIDDMIESYIGHIIAREKRVKIPKIFVNTSVSKKIFEVANACHIEGEIGLITGPAGVGKTFTLKQYAKENPDVILIEADLGFSAKILFVEILNKLGGPTTGNLHYLFQETVNRLSDSGRMIIIDEAEHLPYKALELVRRIWDKAGIGILLVGMPILLTNLKGKKGEYQQLYSRVSISITVSNLISDDIKEIVEKTLPGSNGLWKNFQKFTHGNARQLYMLLKRAIRIAKINCRQIDPIIIEQASKALII